MPTRDEHEEVAKKAVAGVVGAAVGFAVVGPPGALAGAAVGPVVEAILTRKNQLGARNAEQFVAAVLEQAQISAPDFDRWCSDKEIRSHLVLTAVRSAYWAASRQKVPVLARVVSEAVQDDETIDVSQIIVETLAQLETPHVRILQAMIEDTPVPHPDGEVIGPGGWSEYQLTTRFPGLAIGMLNFLGTLERCGLAYTGGLASNLGRVWNVSDFGKTCLTYLKASEW